MQSDTRKILEIVGVLSVVASLLFVGMQLLLDRRITTAEQYQNRAESRKSDFPSMKICWRGGDAFWIGFDAIPRKTIRLMSVLMGTLLHEIGANPSPFRSAGTSALEAQSWGREPGVDGGVIAEIRHSDRLPILRLPGQPRSTLHLEK